ncbi:MAG: hypothetical protein Fur006_06880 [Coleofasciculaceae cyanobacterium]
MKRLPLKKTLGCIGVATALLSFISPVYGQASESEIKKFPMPPSKGYAVTKNFTRVGDYGYYLQPLSSSPGQTNTAKDYQYVRYTGVSGKRVTIYGAWGNTSIPDPYYDPIRGRWVDACEHAHSSYGVWGKYELLFIRRWVFLGGGGKSGKRDSRGRCVPVVDNRLKTIDPRYGWGKDVLTLDFRSNTTIKEVVIGALSNTHGWGSCTVPSGAFPACFEPSWIIAYTHP